MAGELGSATLELRTDNQPFDEGIDAADKKTETFIDKWAKFDFAKQILEGLRSAFETITDFIKSASDSEDAVSRLNVALLNSKQWAVADSNALQQLASAYQMVTKYSDEEVMSAEKILVTFGATQEMMPKLLRATLDLAAGMGTSLDEAATLISKAMNGNVMALQKLGLQSDATKKQVADLGAELASLSTNFGDKVAGEAKNYADAMLDIARGYGDTAEKSAALDKAEQRIRANFNDDAFNAIKAYGEQYVKLAVSQTAAQTSSEKLKNTLDQIEQKFGGAAAAEGNTFSGKVKEAANAWDDLKEAMGRVVVESPLIRGIIDGVSDTFRTLSAWVDNNKDKFIGWAEQGIKFVAGAVDSLLGKLAELAKWAGFDTISTAIAGLKTGMTGIVDKAAEAGLKIEKIGDVWTNIKSVIEKAGITPKAETESVEETFTRLKDKLIQIMTDAAKAIGSALVDGISASTSELASVGQAVGAAIGDAIYNAIVAKIQGIPAAIGAAVKGAFGASPAVAQEGEVAGAAQNQATMNSVATTLLTPGAAQEGAAQAVGAMSDAMSTMGLGAIPINFVPTITMSPAVPFPVGVANMSAMVSTFVKNVPSLNFSSGLGTILDSQHASDATRTQLSGAVDLLDQGMGASTAAIQSMIRAVKGYAALMASDQMNSQQDYFGMLGAAPGQAPGMFTGQAVANMANALVAKLQAQLGAIASEQMNGGSAAPMRSAASASSGMIGPAMGIIPGIIPMPQSVIDTLQRIEKYGPYGLPSTTADPKTQAVIDRVNQQNEQTIKAYEQSQRSLDRIAKATEETAAKPVPTLTFGGAQLAQAVEAGVRNATGNRSFILG